MKFLVTVDGDEDGVWVAECPAIPECVSQGGTREEAAESIREAIVLCLEVRAERGLPLGHLDATASGFERPRGRAGLRGHRHSAVADPRRQRDLRGSSSQPARRAVGRPPAGLRLAPLPRDPRTTAIDKRSLGNGTKEDEGLYCEVAGSSPLANAGLRLTILASREEAEPTDAGAAAKEAEWCPC